MAISGSMLAMADLMRFSVWIVNVCNMYARDGRCLDKYEAVETVSRKGKQCETMIPCWCCAARSSQLATPLGQCQVTYLLK